MKKVILATLVVVFSLGVTNAQDNDNPKSFDDVVEKAKYGGFKIGANIGVPLSDLGEFTSFNFGFDGAYLFEVIENFEVGALVGYTHFLGDGSYTYNDDGDTYTRNFSDNGFVVISSSGRYYFGDRKFFGGLDLGFAINVSGDAKNGLYARPKFGFDLGAITLIGSYQGISGGMNYNEIDDNIHVSTSGLSTFNFGVEFGF